MEVGESAKIDSVDCRQDRFFTAGLGDIEETIDPGEVPEVVRLKADKVERQLFASFLFDMTNEFFGDVYLS